MRKNKRSKHHVLSLVSLVRTGSWPDVHCLHGSHREDAGVPPVGCAVLLHVTHAWTRQYVWHNGGSAHPPV